MSLYSRGVELDYAPPTGYTFVTYSTLGMFLGASLWWVTVSGIIEKIRPYITPSVLKNMNRVSGFILLSLACVAFLKFYKMSALSVN